MPEAEILGIPFAGSPYPMWVYDRETRKFLEVNDAAVGEYGFTRADFLEKMTLLYIRPAEDVREFLRLDEHPRPTGQSTAERWRHKAKDGTVFSVIITSWELIYRGRPAELVLEGSDQARAWSKSVKLRQDPRITALAPLPPVRTVRRSGADSALRSRGGGA